MAKKNASTAAKGFDALASIATTEAATTAPEATATTEAGTANDTATEASNEPAGATVPSQNVDVTGRAPTEAESAAADADNAIVNAAMENATSIADAAEKAFNSAAEGSESRLMAAVSFLALRLVMQQARKTIAGDLIDDATDGFIFNTMLFNRVMAGKSIYRGDAEAIAAVMATKAEDRKEAATKHVKAKGQKLNKTLALIRQYGFQLAKYVRDNDAGQVREMAQAAQSGVGDKATLKAWTLYIVGQYGSTFSGLTHNLEARLEPSKKAAAEKRAATKAEKDAVAKAAADLEDAAKAAAFAEAAKLREEKRDKVAEAMDIIATMSDADLVSLRERLVAFMADRDNRPAANDAPHTGPVLELTAEAA